MTKPHRDDLTARAQRGLSDALALGAVRAAWHELELTKTEAALLEPGARAFQRAVDDGHLSCVVARDPNDGGWHLSLSHRLNVLGADGNPPPGRLPTWDEVRDARARFVPDAVTMAMILPPRAAYVNIHPTTFHLFEVDGLPYGAKT